MNVQAHSNSSACSEVCAVRTFGSVTHGRRDCRSRCKRSFERTFERSFEHTLERSLEHSNTRHNTPQYAARFLTTLAFHMSIPPLSKQTIVSLSFAHLHSSCQLHWSLHLSLCSYSTTNLNKLQWRTVNSEKIVI